MRGSVDRGLDAGALESKSLLRVAAPSTASDTKTSFTSAILVTILGPKTSHSKEVDLRFLLRRPLDLLKHASAPFQ